MKAYPHYKYSGVPWLGDVPDHWRIEKVKFLARLRGEKSDGATLGTRYVGMEHVLPKLGRFAPYTEGTQEIAESTVNAFVAGDVLFGKLRPYLAKCVVANMDGVCSSEFLVMTTQEDVLPHYLNNVMLIDGFISTVDASTYGAKMPRADWAFISQQRLPVPPLSEQHAIATYVERETFRIDALISEKEQLISLLHENRQSVISGLTSGECLPGDKKETGNVFCPRIPAGWQMVRIGKYARIGNGSTPLKDNLDYWTGGDFPWLNSSVVNSDEVLEGSELVTELALEKCHLPIVEPGAVLVALTGQGKTRGQATLLRIRATINQHLAFIDCDSNVLFGDYLFWLLCGQYSALRMVSDGQGGTKGALTCDDLARFPIPLPPLDLQEQIVKQVVEQTSKIDKLISHAREEIILLKELRASSITDAVLGRVDLRS